MHNDLHEHGESGFVRIGRRPRRVSFQPTLLEGSHGFGPQGTQRRAGADSFRSEESDRLFRPGTGPGAGSRRPDHQRFLADRRVPGGAVSSETIAFWRRRRGVTDPLREPLVRPCGDAPDGSAADVGYPQLHRPGGSRLFSQVAGGAGWYEPRGVRSRSALASGGVAPDAAATTGVAEGPE